MFSHHGVFSKSSESSQPHVTVCDVFFHAKTSLLIFEVQLLHWSIMHHALVLGCHRGDPVNKNDMFGLRNKALNKTNFILVNC